jgi:hypothetical protein
VAAVGLAVVLATFRDYGITWDEPVQSHYGEGVLRYFASGLADRSVDDFLHMRFYGPLFELLAAVAYAGFPDAKYEIRHLLIGICGLAAVLGVIRIASLLRGGFVPLLAPLALVAMPRFYGDAFNNSKDAPFACAFVWAVYAMCRFAWPPEREGAPSLPSRRALVACGGALGAALATRPGGLPLLLGIFAAVTTAGHALRGESARGRLGPLALRSAGVLAVAWLAMVLFWPWAHQDPIGNPVRAVLAAFSYPDTFPVLFRGEVTQSDELPRIYLTWYLWIATPPPLLLLSVLGLAQGARQALRHPRSRPSLVFLAVVLWLLAPLVAASVSRPNVYDGLRHVLFVLPALALLAALGAQALADAFAAAWPTRSALPQRAVLTASAAGLALVIGSSLVHHVRLHPYQTTYFNGFVGGVAGAEGRYETDYWLASYREAIEWVNARSQSEGREIRVLVAADVYSRDCAAAFLAPGVRMAHTELRGLAGGLPEEFDYYVATTRYGLDRNFPDAPVAHRIGRDGATFTLIRGKGPASERSLAERRGR